MIRVRVYVISALTLIAAASAAASAQQINVTVNGSPVQFTGTKPLAMQGRVLVPLRGVLEQMGAFVDWLPATRTVVAQQGDTYVQLPVGSRTAVVNGRQVTLDVAAAIVGGSTMVPLRFLGEALGADVRWDGATRTVVITTGAGTSPGTAPGGPRITSFSHTGSGWLKGGSAIEVTMQGTPGGTASFEIPGVVNPVAMKQVSPGRYTAAWVVPPETSITISGASVIGLLRVGGQERLIQAANPVSIDTVPPKITNLLPEPGSFVSQSRPNISATLSDGSGSGIDTGSVNMTVNGADVSSQATVTPNFVTYRPAEPLPAGKNTATVEVRDKAGNAAAEEWEFSVRTAADVIASFTHSDLSDLQPGDVITVRMEGEPGGTASFSLVLNGEKVRTSAMQEVSPGVYEGEYTIRKGDNLSGAVIVGTLTMPSGATYTIESAAEIGGPATGLSAPLITSPKEGTAIGSPLVISGTAPPDTQVRLKVEYATTVLGALRMTGVVTEQMVDVGSDGKFKSEPISLGTLVKGRNTEYTITAVAVGAGGKESEPTVVTVSGS